MKTFLSLFWSFLKIGAFTFGGGYAMIPLIEREVIDRKGWVEREQFLELLTLAQTAPGPISLNTAVFVGYKVARYRGAVAAVLGVILPSFFIILVLVVWLADLRFNRWVDAAFKGMRPAVVALIVAPVFNLAKGMGAWKIMAAVAAAFIMWYFGVSPIYFITGGTAAGIIYTLFRKDGAEPAELTEESSATGDPWISPDSEDGNAGDLRENTARTAGNKDLAGGEPQHPGRKRKGGTV